MAKLIFVLLIVGVVALGVWMMRRTAIGRSADAPRLDAMVACAHCGLHVPTAEAVERDGRSYCSAAHRDLGPGAG
jgi:uncharacterized protein